MSWPLFDRIRAFTRSAGLYQQERIFQDQFALDKAVADGRFIDFANRQTLLDQTNLQINRLERYRDYEAMDEVGEVSLGLDLYCLDGNTKIPLLDGTCRTIRELAESNNNSFWVYGFDFVTNRPKPVLARLPHVSGRNAQLVRVTWNGGYIECTPSHKFYTRRGWIKACELQSGDSLIPINLIRACVPPQGASNTVRKAIKKGYEAIQVGSEWVTTHKWVYTNCHNPLPKGYVIHHKNIRRKDNRPENLVQMTWLDHRHLHEQIGRLPDEIEEQRRQAVSKALRLKWQDESYRSKMRPHCVDRGRQLSKSGYACHKGSLPTTNWGEVCQLAKSIGIGLTHDGLAKAARISRATLDRMLVRASLTWTQFKSDIIGVKYDHVNGSQQERIIKCAVDMANAGLDPKCWDVNRTKIYQNLAGIPTAEKVIKHFGSLETISTLVGYNHVVTSVVPLDRKADEVYDLYVDDGNAFAAGTNDSWVIVHNSDEASLVDPERKHTLIIKAANSSVQQCLEDLWYKILLIDNNIRPIIRYLCKMGDFPAEIVPNRDRSGVAALKFMNVYNFTRVETKYGDLVGFYYQDEVMSEPVFLHPWQVMHLRLTSFENIYHPYGRCGVVTSKIWTSTGYKQMKDIKPGDTVYAFDGLKAVPTKVVKFVSSGQKETIIIKTKYRTIQYTPEHPVLAFFRANHILNRHYVMAKDLRVGDSLILPRIEANQGGVKIDVIGDNGNRLTPAISRLIGYFIGCGWVDDTTLKFAVQSDSQFQNRLRTAIVSVGFLEDDIVFEGPTASVKVDRQWANFFSNISKKSIPDFMFRSELECKYALADGLAESSPGFESFKKICFQTQYKSLADSLKVLLDQAFVKDRNVTSFDMVLNKTDGVSVRLTYYKLAWYRSQIVNNYIQNYTGDKIISITPGGLAEVGDIQVESEHHNFISDGVVVHNSILEGGRRAFKQLRLMEDAALIYRITRAADKRMFKIPVGHIPTKEIPEYIQSIAREFKKNRFYDAKTGQFNERFSPLIQEDDFFLPVRPDGVGPEITTLVGAKNLDDIKDIEYFKKKLIAPLKIPFNRVGIGEGAGEPQKEPLSSASSEFSKAVQWIQREAGMGLTKVSICHLAMQGFSIDEIRDFSIAMSATSAIDELYRIEAWSSRATVMSDLKELKWFPKVWIVSRFTDLSPEEIQDLDDIKELEGSDEDTGGNVSLGGGGGGKIGGMDSLAKELGGAPGGPPPGGEPPKEGEIPPSPDGAEGAPQLPDLEVAENPVESLQYELDKMEKKLLMEHSDGVKKRKLEILKKMASRKPEKTYNGFDYLVESNELDNLSSGKGDGEKVIVECTLDQELVESSKKEIKLLLVDEKQENDDTILVEAK